MVKARAIVPLTHPETGEPVAAGAEVELGDDHYRDLRARGAVEASEAEAKAAQTPESQGNYGGRTSRSETGEAVAEDKPKEPPPSEKKK